MRPTAQSQVVDLPPTVREHPVHLVVHDRKDDADSAHESKAQLVFIAPSAATSSPVMTLDLAGCTAGASSSATAASHWRRGLPLPHASRKHEMR